MIPAAHETAPEAAISRQILAIHEESYGAVASVRTHVLETTVLCLLDDIELTVGEAALIAGGREDLVREARAAFQRAIELTFRAVVERETGRRVVSFQSGTSSPASRSAA